MSRIAEVEKKSWTRAVVLVVALIAIAVSSLLIEGKYAGEYKVSRDEYIDEQEQASKVVRHEIENRFSALYRGLRSLSRHPEVRMAAGTDLVTHRETTEFLVDQANDINLHGFPANYYVVSPIGSGGLQVTAIQETHVPWQYRKEKVPSSFYIAAKSQYSWLRKFQPVLKDGENSEYPAVTTRNLVRGLQSVGGDQADPDDAFLLYAVPVYGMDQRVRGTLVAAISLKKLSSIFPNGDFALAEPSMNLALGAGNGVFAQHEAEAAKGQTAKNLIYSEVMPLELVDGIGEWQIWAGKPDIEFHRRNELIAAGQFRLVAHGAMLMLTFLTMAFFHTLTRHRRELIEIGKGLEEEVKQRTTELAHVHKMESIGQLAAGVAHEINTPTQYIGDNIRFLDSAFGRINAYFDRVDALLESLESGERCREEFENTLAFRAQTRLDRLRSELPASIDEALEGIKRVTEIVRAMKDYAHPGAEGLSQADLNKVVESTVTVARNEWKYTADVEFELEQSLPQVQCNAGEIGQVLLNLVVNAAHAIRDTKRSEKGLIKVSTARNGDRVVIKISDNGTGIPERARPHVFDQFYTTKEAGVGTGMGLAIAKKVVDRHRGSLTFTTATGIGTTFCMELPISQAERGLEEAA